MRLQQAPLSWSWIVRSLLLRPGACGVLLLLMVAGDGVGLIFPIVTQRIVDAIVSGRAETNLLWLSLLAVLAIAGELAIASRRKKSLTQLGLFLVKRIARRVFTHLLRVRIDGPAFRTGDILNSFGHLSKIREFTLYQAPQSIVGLGSGLVALALALYYDRVVGIALMLYIPVIIYFTSINFRRWHSSSDAYYAASGRRTSLVSETVHGLPTVKSLALEAAQMQRWQIIERNISVQFQAVEENARRTVLRMNALSQSMTLIVIGLGCWRLYGGFISVGELMALLVLSSRFTEPLFVAADLIRGFQETNVAVTRLREFLAMPREEADRKPPLRRMESGRVVLEELSMTYPGALRPALDTVNVTMPPRGVVAIVGRNGSGKSTLLKILLGLRRDYMGLVTIGGANVKDYDPRWLRGQIGTVDQETFLFSGTVRDNISAGLARDDTVLRAALDFAGATDFVEALPNGWDTELGENGRSLSGGQRQRLSIARAVIRDPALVLLDEPSAFLDPEAALALEQKLAGWGRDRLLILVTHHLAAARQADQILVLDAGRLVGSGRHDDLIERVPVYASLWSDYVRSLENGPGDRSADAVDRAADPRPYFPVDGP